MEKENYERIGAMSKDQLQFCLHALLLTQQVSEDLLKRTLDLCDSMAFQP